MLHVHTPPMVDHVREKCPNNTNAVERTGMQKMAYQFQYIKQGLVNLYKLDKSYCAQHNLLLQKKDAVLLTEVEAVIPEQRLLK